MFLRRTIVAAVLTGLLSPFARAEHFLDPEEAARLLFPEADAHKEETVKLAKAQAKEIERRSEGRLYRDKIRRIEARKQGQLLGRVYIDDVIGRENFITYAAAIDAAGAVRGVEILDYRESHGWEVTDPNWLAAFSGLTVKRPPTGGEISNISGATLSCQSLIYGVRRLLITNEVLGR